MVILSIVVPTKNRANYAKKCLSSILGIESDLFELVVVDNSDDDLLQDWFLTNVTDSRLKYIRKNEHLTLAENFQVGIDAAVGEYVCTIGDDDGVNPEILELVEWAKKNSIDAVTPKFIVDYIWPDLNEKKYISSDGGVLKIKKFGGNISYFNVKKGLNQLSYSCGMDLADTFYIPKLYYGIIRNSILKDAKINIGSNFPGVSPDLSGAIVASAYINKYCVIDYPIFISGSSIKSASGASNLKKHHGLLSDQKHFSSEAIKLWPRGIPKIYTVETVWSQSAYMSLKAIDREDLIAKFNYSKIYAGVLMFNIKYYRSVLESFNFISKNSRFVFLSKFILEFSNLTFRRARYFIKNLSNRVFNSTKEFFAIENIEDANLELIDYLNRNSISIKKILNG